MKNRNSLAEYQREYEILLQKKRVAKIKIKEEKAKLESQRKKKIYEILNMLSSEQLDQLFSYISEDDSNIENMINTITSLSH